MKEIVVVVTELTLRVATTSASEDPYGQGCSVMSAEALVDERADIETLADAQQRHAVVTLRCARLDVSGIVTRVTGPQRFVVSVEEVNLREPHVPWESHRPPSGLRPD